MRGVFENNMPASLIEQIEAQIRDIKNAYHRLLLVVASGNSGQVSALHSLAKENGFLYVNLGFALSQKLLELTERQRALRAPRLIEDILGAPGEQIVLLDHIELLFDVSLQQDPLRLLQGLSRNRTIVAIWSGSVQGNYLIYARPGHPEYRYYPTKDLNIIAIDSPGEDS